MDKEQVFKVKDIEKFLDTVYIADKSYNKMVLMHLGGKRVLFFNNCSKSSAEGTNKEGINKFLELKHENKVDYFVADYPDQTGDIYKYCLFKNAIGKIICKPSKDGIIKFFYNVKK